MFWYSLQCEPLQGTYDICSHSNRNFSMVNQSHIHADEKQVNATFKGGMKSKNDAIAVVAQ